MDAISPIPPTQSSQQLISCQDSENISLQTSVDEDFLTNLRNNDVQVDDTRTSLSKRNLFTITVLCFINLINYMDRFTIAGKK